jgi:hypothetical protein
MRYRNRGAIVCAVLLATALSYFDGGLSDWLLYAFLCAIGSLAYLHGLGRLLESASWRPYAAIVGALGLFFGTAFYQARTSTWHQRVGAIAMDGWVSSATGRGATSHHGGVREWITIPHTRTRSFEERCSLVSKDLALLVPLLVVIPTLGVERFRFRKPHAESSPLSST